MQPTYRGDGTPDRTGSLFFSPVAVGIPSRWRNSNGLLRTFVGTPNTTRIGIDGRLPHRADGT